MQSDLSSGRGEPRTPVKPISAHFRECRNEHRHISQIGKSAQRNRLEGYALTAMFQGFPMFAGIALCLKLIGAPEIVSDRWGAAIFVALASLVHALLVPWLAPKFPKLIRHGFEPLFLSEPVLHRQDRAVAHEAGGFDRTGVERVDAGAARAPCEPLV
jgi:hypothetical protein